VRTRQTGKGKFREREKTNITDKLRGKVGGRKRESRGARELKLDRGGGKA